jgi:hypothetical protein
MKRTWTIIGVADVAQSFKWYQSLLGLPETALVPRGPFGPRIILARRPARRRHDENSTMRGRKYGQTTLSLGN